MAYSRPSVRHRLLRAAIAGLLVWSLAACAHDPNQPARGQPSADPVVASLATGLSVGEMSDVVFADGPADPTAEIEASGLPLDEVQPSVTAGPVTYADDRVTATSSIRYQWPFRSGDWSYETTVNLRYDGHQWLVTWSPSLIHPRLEAGDRLVHQRLAADRAGITGDGGQAVVERTTQVRVGIDKTLIEASQWATAAAALAGRLQLDASAYTERVLATGPQAFVAGATFRQADVPDILDIPGARGVAETALLPVADGLLTEVLGTVREATAEDIEQSDGLLSAGDLVGTGGLQRTFDEQLRGVPGDLIYIAPRDRAVTEPAADMIVYSAAAVAGTPLATSFDVTAQLRAEAALANLGQPAAAVLIRPSDGALLAAAVSPQADGYPEATLNHFAPGSTFKIVTSLALLRHGYTADTLVECSTPNARDGLPISNYSGYPPAYTGPIRLSTAVAQSCNTAFANQVGRLQAGDLQAAAASLGAGVDYDAGGLLYGTVPIPDSEAMQAQMTIGQGGVLMSPVAMAGVIASIAAGQTVVPWMVDSLRPQSTAAPLTADEAAQLRIMLVETVNNGLVSLLQGVAVGAKSGTAEYGQGDPLPTHAWMIAYGDSDRAAAVWVKDGSGTFTAGPIIQALLG
ncbi:MAG: penicillin-binding protein [Propionibacteriaceae bacterium]|jgi:hypothetical protein|nr:penicillin-binding protein [Propionibacteriaceae bacterium]